MKKKQQLSMEYFNDAQFIIVKLKNGNPEILKMEDYQINISNEVSKIDFNKIKVEDLDKLGIKTITIERIKKNH